MVVLALCIAATGFMSEIINTGASAYPAIAPVPTIARDVSSVSAMPRHGMNWRSKATSQSRIVFYASASIFRNFESLRVEATMEQETAL